MNQNCLKTFTTLKLSPSSADNGLIIHRKIKILNVNQALAAMFGYEYNELKEGRFTILDLIDPELRSLVLKNTLIKYEQSYIELRQNGDKRLNLSVADDGIGLPTTVEVHESSFLGLNIVSSLVQQLEGTIERLPNSGTVFKISFPPDQ